MKSCFWLQTIFFALFVGVLVPSEAHAKCETKWCTVRVVELYPTNSGDIRVTGPFEPSSGVAKTKPSICNLVENRYMILDRTNASFSEIFSVLLTQVSIQDNSPYERRAPIIFRFRDKPVKSGRCEIDYIKIGQPYST